MQTVTRNEWVTRKQSHDSKNEVKGSSRLEETCPKPGAPRGADLQPRREMTK